MNLFEQIPYMVCVNLAGREDRRRDAWQRFADLGMRVDRQPGIAGAWVADSRGYAAANRYACSLAKRLAVRRAKQSKAPAMLLFEDDVVLAADLHERLAEIELPDDWGIFFLGCKHLARPLPIAPGLVRVNRAADHHAMAVRAPYYDAVIRGLAGYGKGSPPSISYSDVKMADLQGAVPTYAAFPNLAWQEVSFSDNAGGKRQSHYHPDGRQATNLPAVSGLAAEMERIQNAVQSGTSRTAHSECRPLPGGSGGTAGPPESGGTVDQCVPTEETSTGRGVAGSISDDAPPGFGFLTGAPRRHRLEATFPLRCFINLGRREERRFEADYQFAVHGLVVRRFAAIDGRWVRNTRGHGPPNKYACRLSHRMVIRQARQLGAPAVLVFEDDVILHPEFRSLAEALAPPADWGVVLYGCTHAKTPEVALPGWVRVRLAWGLQAYAVRACCYDLVLRELRSMEHDGQPLGADVAISRLSGVIPVYAAYPNLAWQSDGYSDLMAGDRRTFREDGRQQRLLHVVRQTNREMKERIAEVYGEGVITEKGSGLLLPAHVFTGRSNGLEAPKRWNVEETMPARYFLNLDRRPERRQRAEARFAAAGLTVERLPAVDGNRRRRASALDPGAWGCLMSHRLAIRRAMRAGEPAVLVLEDDAILHPHWRAWAESVALPEDWGILHFGCQHVAAPEARCPGLVRVRGAYSTHAYAVKAWCFVAVQRALARGARAGLPCDVALAELHCEVPTYAFYPNLVWQEPGLSDVKRAATDAYGRDGVQRWHREVLRDADGRMRRWLETG